MTEYIGRRVRFYLRTYGVNVTGTLIKVNGNLLTVNNIMPRVPGCDEVTFVETLVVDIY